MVLDKNLPILSITHDCAHAKVDVVKEHTTMKFSFDRVFGQDSTQVCYLERCWAWAYGENDAE